MTARDLRKIKNQLEGREETQKSGVGAPKERGFPKGVSGQQCWKAVWRSHEVRMETGHFIW